MRNSPRALVSASLIRSEPLARTTILADGKGEVYWHQKAANLRLKLRDQQDEYDVVVKQLDDQDQKPKKLSSSKKKKSSLEKKKMKLEKEMAKTRRSLEIDLPEEARKADAYPGWIRE